MKDVTKYPRKFKIIRQSDPKLRRKQLSQLKRDPYTNAELRGFLRDLFDNDIRYNLNTAQLKKEYGKHKLYKLLKHSMQAGYIQRKSILTPYNNHQGYRKDYHYLLAETPIFRSNFSSSLIEKKEGLECPHFECTLKWDSKEVKIKEKKEKKKKQLSIPKSNKTLTDGDKPPKPPLSLFLRDQVKIKQQLYDGLVEEYTEPIVSMAIDRMNVYMAETGKYQKYECHGAKLKQWLAKDAEQYRQKLAKQEIEKQQAIQSKQKDQEIARYQLIEKQREQRMAQESARRAKDIEIRAREKRFIIEKYMRQYPDYIKQSQIDLCNGVYWYMGECRIIGNDVEVELEKLIASHNKLGNHSHFVEDSEKRTEMAVESNKDEQVVCVVKKNEIQSKILFSVLNQANSKEKSSTNIGYQAQIDQSRWKNKLNSLLKCYERYPMKL